MVLVSGKGGLRLWCGNADMWWIEVPGSVLNGHGGGLLLRSCMLASSRFTIGSTSNVLYICL